MNVLELGLKIRVSGFTDETKSGPWGPQKQDMRWACWRCCLVRQIQHWQCPLLHVLLLLVPHQILWKKQHSSTTSSHQLSLTFSDIRIYTANRQKGRRMQYGLASCPNLPIFPALEAAESFLTQHDPCFHLSLLVFKL